MQYIVPASSEPLRLDVYLAQVAQLSRSSIKAAINAGLVTVDGQAATPNLRVAPGQTITYTPAPVQTPVPRPVPDLTILYSDDDLMIIDKPAGISVHPGAGQPEVSYVSDFAATITTDHQSDRSGIVHRLDKDTSGLLMIARTAAARQYLQTALAERRIAKTYSALVIGRPAKDQLTIDLPLGRDPQHPLRQAVVPNGRPAVTDYEVKTIFKGYTLLEVRPQTGRTHQIRIHLAAIGHPIAGDAVYGPSTRPIGLTRQFLHAIKLEFTGPSGQQISISSQLSPDLQAFLDTLQT